jgi:hypothetical protein
MRGNRHIGIVLLFDPVTLPGGGDPSAAGLGDVRARVLRWVQHGGIPATFATADPLGHPWTRSIQAVPHSEMTLLIAGKSRKRWPLAAERLEACREANLHITSALIVDDQLPGRERRPLGVDVWAYWKPTHDLQFPVQPWRDQDGWQIPLRAWSGPRGSRSSAGWWRSGDGNWSAHLPPVGRRSWWIMPVMSYQAAQLQALEGFLKQLATWSRQGIVMLETLTRSADAIQQQAAPSGQRSILRAG